MGAFIIFLCNCYMVFLVVLVMAYIPNIIQETLWMVVFLLAQSAQIPRSGSIQLQSL